MKKPNYFNSLLIVLFTIVLFNSTSCSNDRLDELSYPEFEQNLKVSIEWTAYKFPAFDARVGVSGSFESFEYILTGNSSNIINQLGDSEIKILTNSVNVGDSSTKTSNIAEHFFPYFAPHIDCKVISIDEESAEIAITINEVTKQVIFAVELDEENRTVKMSGGIEDLMVFGAQTAFSKLNEVCGVFHDGFVWPDVSINVTIENYDLLN